ncbi:MAG TPA: citrate synthase [Phycisphaerae bacterium]|nr:citrate synthase [Phycisphaerae bacterium]
MEDKATLKIGDKTYELPLRYGTEGEVAVDISKLRAETRLITLDDGYSNTGSCESGITFIDGEKGILRYRGYPIEQLAEHSTFVETAYLLIFGELPRQPQMMELRRLLSEHEFIHEDMRNHFEGFPPNAHPMAILSAMINALGAYQPAILQAEEDSRFMEAAARLMSKVRTIAAASYKKSLGQPMIYPRYDLQYVPNFLHMMFSKPYHPYEPLPEVVSALRQILILHADHEQNCSTSTVRMVGSSQANLYASVAAGVCALWGPLHGGANQAAVQMLIQIQESGESTETFIAKVKDKTSRIRLMGFGHRVYKSYDPRARILKEACDGLLKKLGIHDPLLDVAKQIEEAALKDPYFIERNLYPNVDFYSGIIMRAIGIPLNMFPVMFAIGRMPGWIAHWREAHLVSNTKIHRPRQLYIGPTTRNYMPLVDRP